MKAKLILIGTVTALLVSGVSLGLAQTAPTTGGVFDLYRLPKIHSTAKYPGRYH
jgi:hypothetical protein